MIMAVLNVTPDSFSDGGLYIEPQVAVEHALERIAARPSLIAVGTDSTRPGPDPVSAEEEIRRVVPAIEALRAVSDVAISIDTTKAAVARAAIAAGADIINDISGFKRDPEMLSVAAETGAGCMIMHMRGTPQTMQQPENLIYDDLAGEIFSFFEQQIAELEAAGVERNQLMIDPGIGFSKSAEQNLELINRLDEFLPLELPILLGTSRKSFIGKVLDRPEAAERVWGTAASIAVGIVRGARVVRVHDIAEMHDVCRLTDAILGSA